MTTYLFFLGRQPDISAAEIKAVFSALNINILNKELKGVNENSFLIITTDDELNVTKLMNRLGGTIKIAEKIESEDAIEETIIKHIEKYQADGKIHFAISGSNNKNIGLGIKKTLKANGRNARYIEINNTATILHNNLVVRKSDYTILDKDVFFTTAIQPIEDLAERDFGRPGSDSRSGMLPPKLARIMINMSGAKQSDTLLDPFCGSGTVLTEAAYLGFENLIGSDISQKALEDTVENLEWLKSKEKLTDLKFNLYLCGAENIHTDVARASVDVIVSEPFMGNPLKGNEKEKFLNLQIEKLSDLYLQSFAAFHKILVKGGTVVFIIPSYLLNDKWLTINCVEKIKQIGFSVVPLSSEVVFLKYWRQDQHLARNIWCFRKN